ncbi:MAG: copper amine oxidase N-terminal domain-containing protein [Candidatus Eremiobacteraeota bacterium]|nr:copper amine oxidase N-terminal domain-containing protein [Candidatus Eremiobacteraeota bacterium]
MFASFARSLAAGTVVALALTSFPPVARAQEVTIRINGQALYLNPGPIERAGRVFVPLRGIFERLGATVVYAAGTINATKASTTVSLHIGNTQATVNGQPQMLDVAPFIVGATTYVPLRFIAQSLGADVGYDSSTRVVAIAVSGALPPRPPPPPMPPPNPPPMRAVNLQAQQPAPGAEIRDRFRLIAAEFTRSVQPGSVRVWLDGNNITSRCGISSTAFSYKPPAPLDYGSHTVQVIGRARDGAPLDRSWSFRVVREATPVIQLTIYQPPANAPVGRTFTVSGNTLPNANVMVTAGASPSSSGQFSGSTVAGAKGNFKLTVTLNTLIGQQAVTVRIKATDPVSSQSTETILRLRLNQ